MHENNAGPSSTATHRLAPLGASLVLIATYALLCKWLASFGQIVSSELLTVQLACYSIAAIIGLVVAHLFCFGSLWKPRDQTKWLAALTITSAILVLCIRFLIKQPPSGWSLKTPQQWREIAEAYLVGRTMVPIAEEILFRGLLLSAMERAFATRPVLAVLISAAAFGLLHWPPLYGFPSTGGAIEVLSACAAGLAFGALKVWTRSILPGLGLHSIGNSIGF